MWPDITQSRWEKMTRVFIVSWFYVNFCYATIQKKFLLFDTCTCSSCKDRPDIWRSGTLSARILSRSSFLNCFSFSSIVMAFFSSFVWCTYRMTPQSNTQYMVYSASRIWIPKINTQLDKRYLQEQPARCRDFWLWFLEKKTMFILFIWPWMYWMNCCQMLNFALIFIIF